ncbi:binding-protein-dependent transport system inner membrane protein [Pseudomonas putida S11]|nr:binding-protein-dependent transport system inner membrane protein [Pseudomonas putida S11]
MWLEGGSWQFILGTDELGRDLLSRLIQGARLSLLIGLSSVVMSLIPGILLGLLAGFFPQLLGPSIMRLMDVMLALPSLLLAVAIVAILGPGLINTVIAIAIVSLPSYVRLTRAAVMGELNRDYVTAARLAGAGLPRLMFVTVLPNCMAPLIVQATLSFSSAILDAAALGFLGLGVQPPTPEWGDHAGFGPRLHRARLVGGEPARPDHSAQCAGNQPDGRRPARCAGPETQERRLRRTPCHCCRSTT